MNKHRYGETVFAWCGKKVPLSNKRGAMPHHNGAQQCMGGAQHVTTHERLRAARK